MPAHDSTAGSAPVNVRPMLATLSEVLPTGEGWAYEMKWDGVRALAVVERGAVRLTSRNGNDVTVAYPEIQHLSAQLGSAGVMLDGEIVAADEEGRASFQLLQSRMHLRERTAVERMAREVPVAFMIFDVLWFDGHLVVRAPYTQRRALLDELGLRGPAWQTPPSSGDGEEAFRISKELGFEGVVAKRLESPYQPGRRAASWRKVKHQLRQEFAIGGWVFGESGRAGKVGALLIGYHDDDGVLRYAGKVGTGFTDKELDRLASVLAAIEIDANPFGGAKPFGPSGVPRDAHFVEPTLVAEVRFTEWTAGGRIRHPAYLGMRADKNSNDVARE